MPSADDVFYGIRNFLVVAMVLLFVSAIVALLTGLVGINYPGNAASNVCLWLGLAIGSYVTSRNRSQQTTNVLSLGLVLGVVSGILVIMATLVIQKLAQIGTQSVTELLLVLGFYAILGVAGALLSGSGSNRSDVNAYR